MGMTKSEANSIIYRRVDRGKRWFALLSAGHGYICPECGESVQGEVNIGPFDEDNSHWNKQRAIKEFLEIDPKSSFIHGPEYCENDDAERCEECGYFTYSCHKDNGCQGPADPESNCICPVRDTHPNQTSII